MPELPLELGRADALVEDSSSQYILKEDASFGHSGLEVLYFINFQTIYSRFQCWQKHRPLDKRKPVQSGRLSIGLSSLFYAMPRLPVLLTIILDCDPYYATFVAVEKLGQVRF